MALFYTKFYKVSCILKVLILNIITCLAVYFMTSISSKRGCREMSLNNTHLFMYEEIITGRDMEILLETTDAFHKAMKDKGVTYFMYSGTLLGSWRHHGLVPWDDDVDMMVPKGQSDLVQSALGVLQPEFHLNKEYGLRWKFYSNRSRRLNSRKQGWPYIDISFYLSNKTHLWDEDVRIYPNFKFRLDLVFPLKVRPFLKRMLPAPADTKGVLSSTFDLRICQLGGWDHRKEKARPRNEQHKVPCQQLETFYAFVRHVQVGSGCRESLVRDGNEIIEQFNQDNSTC